MQPARDRWVTKNYPLSALIGRRQRKMFVFYSAYQRSAFTKKVNYKRWLLQIILANPNKISDYNTKGSFGGMYAFNAW